MLKYRQNIVHCRQDGRPNCGPVALCCLFDTTLEELEKIVRCSSKGTRTYNVVDGLYDNGIQFSHVNLDEDYKNNLWWIETCSYRWPIYASCEFVWQGKRGRPATSYHAVLFANGFCYDGHASREEPIAAIAQKFNKKFHIKDLLIFEHELPGWKERVVL